MRGRVAKLALIAWVGALLLLPLAGYALGFRPENIENRTLAKGPGWSLHTLAHSSAWHHAADAFSDHMPLRDRAIHWRAETEFDLFHDSPRPDLVLVGRDNWLFLREEFTTCELYPTITPLQIAQAFQLAHAAARSSGRELYTMLVPAKATIEADHYRDAQYSFESCPRAREQELERLLRGQPGVIDLWSAFRAAKRGGDLWIPNDSHTDTRGSIALAHALVDALRPSAWEPGLEQSGPATSSIGDLDVLAGITNTAQRHPLVLHGTPKNPIREHLLAFGDSQFEDSDPEVAPYVPDRQVLGLDGLLFGAVPRPVIRAAHLIVVESVQRTTYQRVVAFSYPLPLVDAFVADIQRQPARYADNAMSSPLTLPAGVVNIPIAAASDDARAWRLLVFKVLAAGAPLNFALLDAGLIPRASPDSARGAMPAGSVIALAVPPGVAMRDVRLSIDAPAGATLSPLQIAPLSRD
jgi:SGNH hydrolase-like domain, acetyltransferase AlgX